MTGLETVVAILLLAAVAYVVAERIGVPYPVLLVSAGMTAGALPWVRVPDLSPETVFAVFLPPLLYYAAYFVPPSGLRKHAGTIGMLAMGLVVATVAAVTVILELTVPGIPLAVAAAAGALVAPTDPVAATSVFRRAGAPERLVTIVEGEGLINDGAALVLYSSAVAATVAGSVQASTVAWDLLVAPAGGIALGLGVGALAVGVRRRLDEPIVEITISLFTPYLTYLLAEGIGVSGILATVAAGVYVGSRTGSIYAAASRLQAYAFLDVLVFLLNGVLFTLVGIELVRTVHAVPGLSNWRVAAVALMVVAAVVGVRLVWLLAGPLTVRHRRTARSRYAWQERAVVGWSGMRGGVSLAAALALPHRIHDGSPLPFRGLVLVVAAAVIVSTLVLQGTSLPWLLHHLRVGRDDPPDYEQKARALATQAALDWLDDRIDDGAEDREAATVLRTVYESRLTSLAQDTTGPGGNGDGYGVLGLEMIGVERAAVMALHDAGRISGDVLRRIEHDLDLEESRLRNR